MFEIEYKVYDCDLLDQIFLQKRIFHFRREINPFSFFTFFITKIKRDHIYEVLQLHKKKNIFGKFSQKYPIIMKYIFTVKFPLL